MPLGQPSEYQDAVARTKRRPCDRTRLAVDPEPIFPKIDERLDAATSNGHHATRMPQLYLAAKAIAHQLETQQLADSIAEQGVQLLTSQQAIVALMVDDQLKILAIRNSRDRPVQGVSSADESLMQTVVRDHQSLICDRGDFPRSALCVPILNHQSRVQGVLCFLGPRGRDFFGPSDVQAAECLANLAATGFDRSRIFDRMHEWTNSLETLLAFNAAVNQHLSPAELLRRLVQHAVQFLKSTGGMAGIAVTLEICYRANYRRTHPICQPIMSLGSTILTPMEKIVGITSQPTHSVGHMEYTCMVDIWRSPIRATIES